MGMFFLALAAGAVTVTSPCIIPILPIILGSVLKDHKWYPVYLVLGMSTTFTVLGILFGAFGSHLPVDRIFLNQLAMWLIGLMGVALLVKPVGDLFSRGTSALTSWLGARGPKANALGQPGEAFALGSLLGIVWAPCAGPILGSIILLASSTGSAARAGLLLFTYSVGAGIPMLVIAYGGKHAVAGRRFVQERSGRLKAAFGAVLVLTAILMATGVLRKFEYLAVPYVPLWSSRF
ncbi:cytochrome c biogenesis protein CcdA [Patescibacteria group bacterium]|nr:MAG: cytochrome c biogenesis protein CcdA [Patescibacteria group bacterium]